MPESSTSTSSAGAPEPFSINLGAESLRTEMLEAYRYGGNPYGHTAEQVELLARLPDRTLGEAVFCVADDAFWEQYDRVRRAAIEVLTREYDDTLAALAHNDPDNDATADGMPAP